VLRVPGSNLVVGCAPKVMIYTALWRVLDAVCKVVSRREGMTNDEW
jgi:hypothetical protein